MTVLWAAAGRLQTSFDDRGETQVAAVEMQRRLLAAVAGTAENERQYLRVGIHQSSREIAPRIASP